MDKEKGKWKSCKVSVKENKENNLDQTQINLFVEDKLGIKIRC